MKPTDRDLAWRESSEDRAEAKRQSRAKRAERDRVRRLTEERAAEAAKRAVEIYAATSVFDAIGSL